MLFPADNIGVRLKSLIEFFSGRNLTLRDGETFAVPP